MERLTSNMNVSEMGMVELAHNSCYVKNGTAWYRDYDKDIDARTLTRQLLKDFAGGDDAFTCDEDFDEYMNVCLVDGFDSLEGLIAIFYRNLWAMADLHARLKHLEDLKDQGRLLELLCTVGDTGYTNSSMQGWYFRKESRPYKAKVVFVGINGTDNYMNVDFGNGHMLQFKFSDIGRTVFLTREEAERAEKREEEK